MAAESDATAKQVIPFGAKQAFAAMLGFMLLQLFITFLIFLGRGFFLGFVAGVEAARRHVPVQTLMPQVMAHMAKGNLSFTVSVGLAAYLLSALLVAWYVLNRGESRLRLGNTSGFAWRPASSLAAYGWALLLGVLLVLLVVMLLHFVPPPHLHARQLGIFAGLDQPGWIRWAVILTAVVIAPTAEEFIFRGAGFAGLAERLGPLWAAVLVTLVFMLAHAASKIYYPLGFLYVGLLSLAAIWLRVRYQSIRPGILLHAFYNFMLVVVIGAAHLI